MLTGALSKIATDVVTDYLKRRITNATGNSASTVAWAPDKYAARIETSIDRHLREVVAWSSRMQFYGMSRSEETDSTTIPLRFHTEPRRFRGVDANHPMYREMDLLNNDRNFLLLGDPGSGKTTTLKRLATALLTSEAQSPSDTFQLPIVLRLRELAEGTSLFDELAVILGIRTDDLKPTSAEWWPAGQKWLGDIKLETAIAEILDAMSAALLVDGLDEISRPVRARIEPQLEQLARSTQKTKIIVSCRTGDYSSLLDGYDLVEIAPLEEEEILQISRAWLPNIDGFREQLRLVPYQDIADRPLLLTQLLFIFRQYGYLPEQPCQIYQKVVMLLLQDWDAERRITRSSKYARFVPARKAAFLAALAYHLTFRVRRKTFSVDNLRHAYVAVREQFGLPLEEAAQVAAELETHTGILVAAGAFTYEFAHLSLQEYLCGEYLVREPFAEYLSDYMADYPAPVAVAVSLAAEPSTWFAALFLQHNERRVTGSLSSFLSRVLTERPYFSQSYMLGVAMLKLYYDAPESDVRGRELLDRLAAIPAVRSSIQSVLSQFVAPPYALAGADVVHVDLAKSLPNRRGLRTPRRVAVSRSLLRELTAEGDIQARAIEASLDDNRPRA